MRRVLLDEMLPLLRQIILREDRPHRALVHAQVAVDAVGGVDVKLIRVGEARLTRLGMNAIHRANGDAGGVLHPDARQRDDVSHKSPRKRSRGDYVADMV